MAFQDNLDGSVTDLTSGLVWKKAPTARLLWDTAAAEAEPLWRIPTLDELQTLIADQRAEPAGCAAAFGEENLPTDWFWVYKVDPAHETNWQASGKSAADAEYVAMEKPGHVAALFVWQGFKPWNNRRIEALCRYVQMPTP